MTPDPELLNLIADRLSRPIPKPAQPIARTKLTWQTLKLNQKLRTRVEWFQAGQSSIPLGTELTVTKVDSLGVDLTLESECDTLRTLRWTQKDWKGTFEKVKKGRKKK